MFKKKSLVRISILIFLIGFYYTNSFALTWFQKTTINKDQSGTMTISYSTSNSELKGAEIFKSLPFTEDKIRETFSSGNNKIKSINVNNKKPDSTSVTVLISFQNINKLNTSPGFSKLKTTWYKNGDSTVFMYQTDKNAEFADNVAASCIFELPTKEILRSSGTKKGDNAISLQIKPENFKNGYTVFAVFKNLEGGQEKNSTTGKDEKESGKSCGLFGIEMPFIFSLGMLLIRRRIKK